MDMLLHALSEGKLCVIDVSQMRGGQSLVLSGLILRRIFDRNQREFTAADPKTIPTIAVVEEAQSVLNEAASAAEPYIAWVKEGRKYDLGALLITQQPGSIPVEILSQGDNWFIFHLLSAADLGALRKANAHFSEDLLSSLLNEPIPGQGVFWSSVGGKPYPVSLRVQSFERLFALRDPQYNGSAANTHAVRLRATFADASAAPEVAPRLDRPAEEGETSIDVKAVIDDRAIEALRNDTSLMSKLDSVDGIAWGALKAFLLDHLSAQLDDRDTIAYHLVRKALDRIVGPQNQAWESYRNPTRNTTYVRKRS